MICSLNYAILTNVLYALKDGDVSYGEKLGFTFEEMNSLNQLSLEELFIISKASHLFIVVTIHHDIFQKNLILSRRKIEQQRQITQAIRLGGSISLLNNYFGLTSNEVCLRRRLLGVNTPHGRTPIPDESTDAEIWRMWQKQRAENINSIEALEIIMQITESLFSHNKRVSLTAVWNRITLCEQEKSKGRVSHAG
ncbi:DUF2857 domain-containing protein [Citrobacter amalonaticus]|nr:DUF2857 domain-containing protein [Citrobacter amalonaticus]